MLDRQGKAPKGSTFLKGKVFVKICIVYIMALSKKERVL
jgi:hypothetical protein